MTGQNGSAYTYCGVDGGQSALVKTNTNWTLSLAMKFLSGDPPPVPISTMAVDLAYMTSGWANLGYWTGIETISQPGVSGAAYGPANFELHLHCERSGVQLRPSRPIPILLG